MTTLETWIHSSDGTFKPDGPWWWIEGTKAKLISGDSTKTAVYFPEGSIAEVTKEDAYYNKTFCAREARHIRMTFNTEDSREYSAASYGPRIALNVYVRYLKVID